GVFLGVHAKVDIGNKYTLFSLQGDGLKDCPLAGNYVEVEVGRGSEGEIGAGVKFDAKGGVRVLPDGSSDKSGQVDVKSPMLSGLTLGYDGGLTGTEVVAEVTHGMGIGAGFDVGAIRWYNIALRDSGRCCNTRR